jgi:dTDP-4-amino-4,6-dideoxygalactose transaminase
MKVPLLDLRAQYRTLRDEIAPALSAVIESQHFILGPAVAEFEQACAAYCRTPRAVGVSSGTDALLIALMAEGIGPGHEVITTPYTFFATAGSIARVGARPVFVDIDPETFNLRPDQIESRITENTRAVMPVHLYGQCADMDPILEVARRRRLVVIEDAAQAIGAEYRGQRAGSMGEYGCFSFFPSKNLGGFGDGGLVTTADSARADRLEILRGHGARPKYHHRWVGGNFRLDALQAAVLSVKLRHLDDWTAARQRNADRYDHLFEAAGLAGDPVRLPKPSRTAGDRHIFNQYVIRVPRRNELQQFLSAEGVGTEIYYPVPLHLQECFAYLGYRTGDCPESERAAAETLALPIYPELTDEQAEYVVAPILRFYRA